MCENDGCGHFCELNPSSHRCQDLEPRALDVTKFAKTMMKVLLFRILLVTSSWCFFVVAKNPFSSNVVALTPQNWKEVVLDNPHAVFVNICRVG